MALLTEPWFPDETSKSLNIAPKTSGLCHYIWNTKLGLFFISFFFEDFVFLNMHRACDAAQAVKSKRVLIQNKGILAWF